nr:MAG TPA: hypothetical protein [Caudoviricetes sp.]
MSCRGIVDIKRKFKDIWLNSIIDMVSRDTLVI